MAFERYIGIDYSGAETPASSLKGLRMYMADRLSPPFEIPAPGGPRKNWTRRGLAERLVELLSERTPTLVGIDHAFSFPLQYFEKYKLPLDWTAFLDDFQLHWPTDKNIYVDFVREGVDGNGAARAGRSTWRRITEIRTRRAKSVFHFDAPGSVAKSTHSGLPWLRYIRSRTGAHFWPFDGWEIPPGRSAVAEVYPALWSKTFPQETRDGHQHDAYSIAAWLRHADANGSLNGFLNLHLEEQERKIAEIEGWILGVTALPLSSRPERSVVEGPAVSLQVKNKRESGRADRTVSSQRIGIIMHGITGRMGYNQHLVRSIVAIREQGGVALSNGDRVMPDPILVGRNLEKVSSIAARHGIKRVAKDIASALADPEDTIFFDAGSTQMRVPLLTCAIEAGKHVYCEKPLSETLEESLSLVRLAKAKGVKSGVVQDKLYLPGLRKLRMLKDAGFFGRILAVRGEFGYWVFEGDLQPAQRPSWNYRKADGGGIILDMLPHWRYVLDNLFGAVEAVSCIGATHIAERFDESGAAYKADAEDAAYATFQLEGGVIANINSSWAVRVRRDDLVTFQVDGTHGSAVAGLTRCYTQHRVNTPRPVWNPDVPQTMQFTQQWEEVPDTQVYENGFKLQWEDFIRHVVENKPWGFDLLEGAKGVQLAELGMKSWAERRWVDVPPLPIR